MKSCPSTVNSFIFSSRDSYTPHSRYLRFFTFHLSLFTSPSGEFLILNVCHDEIEHAVFDGIDTPEEVPNGILAQHATFEVLRQEPQFVRPEISLPFIAGIVGIKFQDVILKLGDCVHRNLQSPQSLVYTIKALLHLGYTFNIGHITQLSEVIASLEVIEVKGVNDDTQSMKIRNEERCG